MKKVITLLTDFGLRDPYVGAMKGVILSICPDVNIVDISHEIRKFDIRQGAYVLAASASFFPKGTIHVGVVDPGVGTARKAIIMETKRSFYIGPDNGLLTLAALREGVKKVVQITNSKYMLPRVSRTFHGRDIFAPAAAYLANGVPIENFGPLLEEYEILSFSKPHVQKDQIEGEIIYIDGFGNIVTNIYSEILEKVGISEEDKIKVLLNDKLEKVLKICKAYNEVKKGEFLAIIGSGNFLEISINQGNAAKKLNVKEGAKIKIKLT
ncbi:MAG: S-adenosyl-l-methionine hydroxide adenosyltransferase family protein [Candidatus Baldrarchaeota archaeon]